MLSIIMPVYNKLEYLRDSVQSVLSQTERNLELILVDDGSTDGSGGLCDTLAGKDPRITVIHKRNGGVASARNVGLDAARGDFIGWVDADDLVHPEMFRVMMELAERHGADIVQCSHCRRPEDLTARVEAVETLGPIDSLKRIYRSHYTNSLSLCSKLCRRSLFDNLRFTEGTAFEDDEVVPQLLERSRVSVFCEAKLYCYVKREGSIVTAPKPVNILALTNHLEARMLWFRELDEALYLLARDHFYGYLKRKVCEEAFRGTKVQYQAAELLKKHRKLFFPIAHIYDKITIYLLYLGKRVIRWVGRNDFAPIQNIISKLRVM